MKGTLRYMAGVTGASGYGSKSTAEQVTEDFPSSHHTPSPLTAIITGGTSGIGAETTRVLAKRGVRMVMPVRDMKKGAMVREQILKESPKAEIIVLELDLSSFASIRRFCSHFLSLGLPLNILINNAGRFSRKLEFSEDKIELTFATNYLGHYLLTDILVEKMIETAVQTGIHGRIINVSSVVHRWVKRDGFRFNQMINPNPETYDGTRAYAQSKLANILHVKEMARRLKARSAKVTINAVHPGIVKTPIMRDHNCFITDSLFFMASKLLKSTSQGAATTCYVALSKQTEGVSGKHFSDCNESNTSGLANDDTQAHHLWNQTRALIHRRSHQTPLALNCYTDTN